MAAIWQVYWVAQQKAIRETHPPQPTDDSKPYRGYVIVAPPDWRSKYTCCPIQDKGVRITMTEVELPNGYGKFITKDCKILCHEIYTLPSDFFNPTPIGMLQPNEQGKVKLALKSYLRIQ